MSERHGADKDLSNSELENWIFDTESAIGPITDIDCAAGGTVGTFDIDGEPVSGKARVFPDPEGTLNCPAPSTEVCRGRAYISGQCVPVLICR